MMGGAFSRVIPAPKPLQFYMDLYKVSESVAASMARAMKESLVLVNSKYQVTVDGPHAINVPGWPDMMHLSIVPLDGVPIHSWQVLQDIKNEICGEESEAVELYPAESRLVDIGSNYHLWVFTSHRFRFPIGYQQRMVKKEIESGNKTI